MPSRPTAAPAGPGLARAEHVTRQCWGLACLACQGGSGSGSWTGDKEQKRSPELLCGALASECGGKGRRQRDFCVPGAGARGPSREPPAQAHLPPSLLALWLPAAPPFLPGRSACLDSASPRPALPFTPFPMNQPQKLDDFFLRPGPASPLVLLTAGFQHPLSGLSLLHGQSLTRGRAAVFLRPRAWFSRLMGIHEAHRGRVGQASRGRGPFFTAAGAPGRGLH